MNVGYARGPQCLGRGALALKSFDVLYLVLRQLVDLSLLGQDPVAVFE